MSDFSTFPEISLGITWKQEFIDEEVFIIPTKNQVLKIPKKKIYIIKYLETAIKLHKKGTKLKYAERFSLNPPWNIIEHRLETSVFCWASIENFGEESSIGNA